MKPDQDRVRNMLTDTVTLLCRNGLVFAEELRIEGLLGVTVDNRESFYIHIGETFGPTGDKLERDPTTGDTVKEKHKRKKSHSHRSDDNSTSRPNPSPKTTQSRPSPNSSHSATNSPSLVLVKNEPEEDVVCVDTKEFKRSFLGVSRDEPATKKRASDLNSSAIAMQGPEVIGTCTTSLPVEQFLPSSDTSASATQWQELAVQAMSGVTSDSQMAFDAIPTNSTWRHPPGGVNSGSDMVGIQYCLRCVQKGRAHYISGETTTEHDKTPGISQDQINSNKMDMFWQVLP